MLPGSNESLLSIRIFPQWKQLFHKFWSSLRPPAWQRLRVRSTIDFCGGGTFELYGYVPGEPIGNKAMIGHSFVTAAGASTDTKVPTVWMEIDIPNWKMSECPIGGDQAHVGLVLAHARACQWCRDEESGRWEGYQEMGWVALHHSSSISREGATQFTDVRHSSTPPPITP